ncbi:TetR/AcrR family transcriptional regulator [Pseudochrobactrum kiredjianiae]|uniref:TetR/AcrR family transcriptional regulator n=1 Tax=Pseudochrobactrum kiredjianiae TaxID=386305 RepID=A0ABW3V786_9HYPH|nr:TetR/AcrR family transcriptional regulator [Pseudochrobactrum kiredjianiae]MDM7850766.1 TetR/AcrR family transcriptional regulator [Pseudochrobactrum kiredjianiae]
MTVVTEEQESGWRGSKELWLEAAYQLLVEGGIDNVRILSLAKMLKLSRTSFYWFFKDRKALLDALLLLWQEKNTSALLGQSQLHAASLAEATLNLFDCWLNNNLFDSQLEHAIRSWGVQSPTVAQALTEADTMRMEAIKHMFIRHGSEPLVADVRSRALYLTQIGYISMNTQEDTATRLLRVPSYVAIFSGALPSQQELESFQHRHNH